MASLKVRTAFGYHAAVFGFIFRDLERSCVQRVTMENRPSKTGVVRRIALSDHWRWVSMPRWARVSSKVTSTCQRLTNQARISRGRALRSVARKAWGLNSPVGSRTRSQRIGTGATPPRYHNAAPLEISTRRLVWPYQRLTQWRCQETLRSSRTVESFFRRLPLVGGRPRPLRFCGGKPNRFASSRKRGTTQTRVRTAARNSIAANALSATSTMERSGSQRWICRAAWRAQSSNVLGARDLPA